MILMGCLDEFHICFPLLTIFLVAMVVPFFNRRLAVNVLGVT